MYDKSRRKRKDNHQPLMFYIGQLVATIVPVLKLHRKLVGFFLHNRLFYLCNLPNLTWYVYVMLKSALDNGKTYVFQRLLHSFSVDLW